eukprot:3031748-Heterocapsa_arctica.AAC.2
MEERGRTAGGAQASRFVECREEAGGIRTEARAPAQWHHGSQNRGSQKARARKAVMVRHHGEYHLMEHLRAIMGPAR